MAAHDSAATWMINVSTRSPFFISLMSTVASLPFFLFTLPAGALADKVDRQRVGMLYQCWIGSDGCGLSSAWLTASAQSLHHPGKRVLRRNWICLLRSCLDINCASSGLGRGVALRGDLEWFAIQVVAL